MLKRRVRATLGAYLRRALLLRQQCWWTYAGPLERPTHVESYRTRRWLKVRSWLVDCQSLSRSRFQSSSGSTVRVPTCWREAGVDGVSARGRKQPPLISLQLLDPSRPQPSHDAQTTADEPDPAAIQSGSSSSTRSFVTQSDRFFKMGLFMSLSAGTLTCRAAACSTY